jgi:peptide/nickel transport system permease protein
VRSIVALASRRKPLLAAAARKVKRYVSAQVPHVLFRRLLAAALTVVAVSFVAFVGFGLTLDPTNGMGFDPTPHGHAARLFVRQHYHLDDPILSRYVRWAGGVFQHGFGNTASTDVAAGQPIRFRTYGEPIGPQLWNAAKVTAALVGAALVLVVAGSAFVGVVSTRRRPFGLGGSTRFLAYLGAAVPVFLVGDLLRRATTGQGHVAIGSAGPTLAGGGWFLLGPPVGGPIGWVRHLALPVFVLALGLTGIYARYVRSSMLAELDQPYITVARAKGLSERRVLVRHALRGGLAPFVALISLEMGAVIGASIAVDAVFGSGGLASVFLSALGSADPFELTAILVVSALIVCCFTFLGEWLVAVLDPRVSRT